MRTLPAVRGAALAAAAATIALTGCTSHAASDHHAIVPAARASLPAGTAATGGWHGVTLIGPAAQAWTSQFAATAADDSWSTWQPCSSCQGTAPRVERWNGHAWATVPLPHRLATAAAAAVAVGASSASNAWLVAPGQVVRWNGGSWQAEPIPSWAVLGSAGVYKVAAAVFGPASAWLFSLDRNASPTPYYAARDDGGRWSKVPLPGAPEAVSALAPDDIWVLGATRASAATNNPSVILVHWNGTRWATVTAPTVRVPDRASVDNADLVATGPHDAWLVRQTQKPNSEGEPGPGPDQRRRHGPGRNRWPLAGHGRRRARRDPGLLSPHRGGLGQGGRSRHPDH